MITPRENLLRVLRHEMPEWIPITGHCDPYNQPHRRGMDEELQRQLGAVKWHDLSTITFSKALGLDIADFYRPPIASQRRRVTVEGKRDGDAMTTTWRTPVGELRQIQHFSPQTNLWYTVEHAVKTLDDLPILAAVYEDEQFMLDPKAVEALNERQALVGDDGIVMFSMAGTPLGQLVRIYAGVENTSYLWADGQRQMLELFRVMADNHLRQYRLAASVRGGDALIGIDDTSTTTISPAMFEASCMDYTDAVADAVHAGGKFYFHHSCGLIRDILDLYHQTKMDAVHAFTTPPIGNATIADGKKRLGDRIVIFTCFDELFGDMSDRAAIAHRIADRFVQAAPGDNFIIGLAADPEHTMEESAFVAREAMRHRAVDPSACRE